jgi:hypothetical protein
MKAADATDRNRNAKRNLNFKRKIQTTAGRSIVGRGTALRISEHAMRNGRITLNEP